MEASGVVFRQAPSPCFSGAGFTDKTHMVYYYRAPRCGTRKEIEKKLKLLRNNLQFSGSVAVATHPQPTLEAADLLLKQLEELRAQEKELKKKRKQEKAKLKAERRKMDDSESSSSSESSDSDCDEVVDMTHLRKQETCQQSESSLSLVTPQPQPTLLALPMVATPEGILAKERALLDQNYELSCGKLSSSGCDDGGSSALVKRIEVCIGGKCKKSGGAALLEEFGRAVGVEGAVVGCKCMGKCRDGPNVRVLNCGEWIQHNSMRTPANSLCIGVGLEDVGAIVADLFRGDQRTLGLSPTS